MSSLVLSRRSFAVRVKDMWYVIISTNIHFAAHSGQRGPLSGGLTSLEIRTERYSKRYNNIRKYSRMGFALYSQIASETKSLFSLLFVSFIIHSSLSFISVGSCELQ